MRLSLGAKTTTHGRHLHAVWGLRHRYGCSSTAHDRSTGQFIDDAALTAKVKASIAEEDKVKVTSVNVNTYRGTVQLSGFVDNEEAKQRAEQAARDVEGVRAVQNDLRIAPAASGNTR